MFLIMNIQFKILIFSLLTVFSLASFSADEEGGWVGAGGDIYTNAINPWFFKYEDHPKNNVINYCIEMDTDYFSSDVETAKMLIELSFQAWKNEFSIWDKFFLGEKQDLESIEFPIVKLATETLIYKSCSDQDVDIRFQFGVLSEFQYKKLKSMGMDPREKVGIAVRTSYDKVSLRGRGFIYFSPDSGPMRVKGDDNIAVIWEKKRIFLSILKHEWGHVFGVAHDFQPVSLMYANMPNSFIKKGLNEMMRRIGYPMDTDLDIEVEKKSNLGIFIVQETEWTTCNPVEPYQDIYNENRMKKLRIFFELDETDSRCIFLKVTAKNIEIQTSDTFIGVRKTIGNMALPRDDEHLKIRTSFSYGVKVITSKEQRVFDYIPSIAFVNNLVWGPSKYTLAYNTRYISGTRSSNVLIRLTTGMGFELVGSIDNQPEVLFRSPTTD